ncbi:ankycorbin-like [Patiria miniata]|uniref:Ubiquitin-like domain-containing protein n=1 Tax=Patiria miniata TaxID=46514 RepID=A0A914B2S0_PATMI|nr:ankycorbin-like [Patiria miniata]
MTQVGVRDATGRFIETFEIFAKLPGPGSLTPITVRHQTTVGELKSLVELVCGIPTDLQLLSYRHHAVLTDGDTLGKLCVLPGARLPVRIAYGYDGLVESALRGDLKEVMRSVTMTKDAGGMAKRMFVAMFIAAHKGFHYLVDRMLCEGAHPDTQTPTGRTALHVACAMGNSGCLDSLLQHGASLDIHDSSGKTAAQTAVSCGQQSAQRRLVLYSRIRANKATREKPCSWSTSPRFPKSKLGSSVTPTLSLQDLAISPGPELMITTWSGREHHHHYFDKRPRSAKAALFQTDSSTSSTESWSSLRDGRKDSQRQQATTESQEESSVPPQEVPQNELVMTRSLRLHDRPKSASSLAAIKQARANSPSVKSVKFAFDKTHTKPASGMSKYSSYHGCSVSPTPPDTHRYSTQTTSLSLKSALRSKEHLVDDDQAVALGDTQRIKVRKEEDSTSKGNQKNQPPSGAAVSADYQETHQSATVDAAMDDSSSGSSCHSTHEMDPKEVNSLRMDYLNDKLREMVGLPVQHPQRLEFMKEREDKQLHGNSTAKRTRKPTPEENERAFEEWLSSKTQDARDRKLVKRVGKMLDDAFGKKDETLIADEDEDQTQKRTPLKFEAWSEKKAKQEQLDVAKRDAEASKQELKKREQLEARLNSGTMVDAWLAEKLQKQRQERLAEKLRERERQRLKTEQEKAAKGVFQKWCMQKEWEELQMLRGRLNSGCKRRPKSGSSKSKAPLQSSQAPSRRTRSHSAPPRRHHPPHL